MMFGGIGLRLGAIKGHKAQAHDPRLLAEPQDLNKQTAEGIEVAEARVADPALIRLLVARQHLKGHILVSGSLNLVPPARWPTAR